MSLFAGDPTKPRKPSRKPAAGTSERERDAMRKRKARAQGREVEIPPPEDPARRAALEEDGNIFEWLRWYFCYDFDTPFTDTQRELVEAILAAATFGGDQAVAAPRGEGKTTLAERVTLYCVLRGIVSFPVILAATGADAERILDNLKEQIEENDRLCADYPEVCVPVRALERAPARARGQIVVGDFGRARSNFRWCGREIRFPRVPGSKAAGAIIATRGLDGAVRGLKVGGRRPDLAIIDDPDTDESAASDRQAEKLERKIDRNVAGLAGQQKRIARVMLTTIQTSISVSAKYTDRAKKPSWKGRRFRFMVQPPEREDLWDEYVLIRRANQQAGDEHARAAHRFYLDHREEMDRGAVVGNVNRYSRQPLPDGSQQEVSALQRFYNLVADIGRPAVQTEYQNDPIEESNTEGALVAGKVADKVNGRPRYQIPSACEHLTAFVDVHDDLLYYSVQAWTPRFSGYVVDYGTYPDQRREYFALRDAGPTLAKAAPKEAKTKTAAILAGLVALVRSLFDRAWVREDGPALDMGLVMIDSGYLPETVREAIAALAMPGRVVPSRGRGIAAANKPIAEWDYKPGDRRGHYWGLFARRGQPIRTLEFDANYWKSRARDGFAAAHGDPAAITIFGADPTRHRLFSEHLAAEYPVPTEGQGRRLEEWRLRPGGPDNHWLDCAVGNMVAASILGAVLPCGRLVASNAKRPKTKRRKVAYL